MIFFYAIGILLAAAVAAAALFFFALYLIVKGVTIFILELVQRK